METKSSASSINTILLLIVGLLVGGIAGYIVGQTRSASVAQSTGVMGLNDVLSPANAYIVEGLTCPMQGCTNPLLTCPGELPRRIRDWVNTQVATGRDGADIRAEIIRTHGANVQKLGSSTVYDTIKNITD